MLAVSLQHRSLTASVVGFRSGMRASEILAAAMQEVPTQTQC